MENIKLSDHFVLSEFTRSSEATKLKIDNTPDETAIRNLIGLCEHILEPLRKHVGTPIRIGSGYRCPKLNKAVGGVSTSNHQKGCAADIHPLTNEIGKVWFDWIKTNLQFDELIWETSDRKHYWIHVAYRPSNNRHKIISYLLKK